MVKQTGSAIKENIRVADLWYKIAKKGTLSMVVESVA